MDNIFWLSKNDHLGLHRVYIDPLVDYVDGLVGENRPIYFEMPVPEKTRIPLYKKTKRGSIVMQLDSPDETKPKDQKTH